MNEEHFNKQVFEAEQLPFQSLESWQMGNCYFCFKFLKGKQAKIVKLKDRRFQVACWKCRIMHLMFLLR